MLIARARGHAVPTAAWVGIAISFGGVLLLTGVDAGRGGDVLLGDLLALLGGMAAAGYVTVGGEVRRTVSTSPYTLLCYGTCAAAARRRMRRRAGTVHGLLRGRLVAPASC